MRRYTEEENLKIIKKISENPSNLSRCFEELAVELGRTPIAIKYRWYQVLSLREESKANTIFFTLGKKRKLLNRKVERKDSKIKGQKENGNKWRSFIKMLFNK